MAAPVAVIDIGSNSVRLVVYEALSRSPTPIFNEKVLCGLGREVATTGRLAEDAVVSALQALRRFRTLCDIMQVGNLHVLATAAARDAKNGEDFVAAAADICRAEIQILSGKREARLSAYGIIAGFHNPDGLVGDLGGGSLELIDVKKSRLSGGATFPLGGLALRDASEQSIEKAEKIVRQTLGRTDQLQCGNERPFFAVGGTWRALARLHMTQKGYPLRVMHGYKIPAREALDFCRMVHVADTEALSSIKAVSAERRPLLAYGALVLEQIILAAKPSEIVTSALGVREGLLYELLDEKTRHEDALLTAARELGYLRARWPEHGTDLIEWTDRLFHAAKIDETKDERRLRHAACYLSDVGWRAHPDYRGEQSLNIIANAAFVGIDHPGRAFLALAIFYRHEGLVDEELSPRIRELASTRMMELTRILGAALRLAFLITAGMPGVLPRVGCKVKKGRLDLELPPDLSGLGGDRLENRLTKLAKILGRSGVTMAA
ncbi:exopolyphosphatase [Agaricicola taiwanensis]|uniref:exopolyphosphatase n=1 Tax=Agaricicola taiwanensis TaxID=591372 RepID=UPI001E42F6EC|nr:exopolyphosphatase [Agaricicola taiwanensis]